MSKKNPSINCEILLIFIISTVQFSCHEQISKKVESSRKTVKVSEHNILKRDTITIEYLKKYNPYGYQTELKKGYYLEFNYFRINKNTPIEMCLNLKKGDKIIDTLNILGYGAPQKNLGYVSADFDEYFAFVQSYGSGNPHDMQLLRKKDGKEIIKGFIVDADENNEFLLYCRGYDSLMLYDIKKHKNNYIENLRNSKEIDCAVSELTDYLKIKKVSSKYVSIDITNTKNETLTKQYNR